MSRETQDRISQVIEEYDYRPSTQAQGLKTNKSFLIGCVVSDIDDSFTSQFIKKIQNRLLDTKYQLIIMDSNNSDLSEEKSIRKLVSYNVDGLIINPVNQRSDFLYSNILDSHQLPIVICGSDSGNNQYPVIEYSNYDAIEKLIVTLLEKNYDKLIFLGENELDSHVDLNQLREIALKHHLETEILAERQSLRLIDTNQLSNSKVAFLTESEDLLFKLTYFLIQQNKEFQNRVGLCTFGNGYNSDDQPSVSNISLNVDRIAELSLDYINQGINGKLKHRDRHILQSEFYLTNSL